MLKLDRESREVPVFPQDPREPYWVNSHYGMAGTLRAYAGYRPRVRAVVPHGVYYSKYSCDETDAVPAVLAYPEFLDGDWGGLEVIPAASPILYALAMAPGRERTGTVVFPDHSTDVVAQEMDWGEMALAVNDLPGPRTVCLYWKDVLAGRARYFDRCTLVTCGHPNDPAFMDRLVELLTAHERAAVNGAGGPGLYAAAAGMPVSLTGPPPKHVIDERAIGHFGPSIADGADHVERVLAAMRSGDVAVQRECADYYLRREAFKTPEGLHEDLAHAEELSRG